MGQSFIKLFSGRTHHFQKTVGFILEMLFNIILVIHLSYLNFSMRVDEGNDRMNDYRNQNTWRMNLISDEWRPEEENKRHGQIHQEIFRLIIDKVNDIILTFKLKLMWWNKRLFCY